MNILDNIKNAVSKLEKSSPSPQLDAEILMMHALKVSREHIIAYPEQLLSKKEQEMYSQLISKRETSIPIAYITGTKNFFGEEFIVTKNVLIPRPETETIIEFALQKIYENHLAKKEITIADLGTGSGAIALTLGKILNTAHVTASDISTEALKVVQKNLDTHPEIQNVTTLHSDLLVSYPEKSIDVVMANLPYLSEEVYRTTSKEVHHEPKLALTADNEGMFFYKELFKQLSDHISKKLLLFLEIDPHQYDSLKADLHVHFPKADIYPITSENKECTLGLYAHIAL